MNGQVQQNSFINLLKCHRNFRRILTADTNQFSLLFIATAKLVPLYTAMYYDLQTPDI